MGTASFAVPTLEKLLQYGFDIAAVVTAPDRPAGRGKKIRYSPVKEFALSRELPLLQPVNLKDPEFAGSLERLRPDVQVVVAFRMLPEAIWQIPPLGTLNLHASLLPQFRGAAPINHALMKGVKETGVTTFMIDQQIDTGRVLKQAKTTVSETETAGELHDRLMEMGADLTVQTVSEILRGGINPVDQAVLEAECGVLFPAPKIFKSDCRINWDLAIDEVYNFIRGLSPLPGAFTELKFADGTRKTLKVYHSKKIPEKHSMSPGSVHLRNGLLEVACKDGFIQPTKMQIEGKMARR